MLLKKVTLLISVIILLTCSVIGRAVALQAESSVTRSSQNADDTKHSAAARLDLSRAMVNEFGNRLQKTLLIAMKETGPTGAMTVCKNQAPVIAQSLSDKYGVSLSRTSLRIRNPNNTPTLWQKAVLNLFESNNQSADSQEYYSLLDTGESRYMQAIKTKPVCLACHGKTVGNDIQSFLKAEYPNDQAVGYEAGDIRGAFSVTWGPAKHERNQAR